MTLAAYLGWLAAKVEHKVANTIWAVCVLDTGAALEGSALGPFSSPATIRAAKARSRRNGYVSGEEMASMFAWLRPKRPDLELLGGQLLLGNKPPAFDVLAWNADSTRLPGQFHCDLLDLIGKNPYVRPGALEIGGLPIGGMSRCASANRLAAQRVAWTVICRIAARLPVSASLWFVPSCWYCLSLAVRQRAAGSRESRDLKDIFRRTWT